ncbi:MAG: hypothetical protein ACYC3N_00070 [Halothiobacillus sp.]|jgi:hypothetical protein
MNQELDDLLCASYPKIFARRHAKDSTMQYGFCCGDGWFNLIDSLCTSLQYMTDERGAPQPVASQVKEKFGQLRFYMTCGEFEATEAQISVIELAGILSARTCEECGCPGRIVANAGWWSVRCPSHEPEGSVSPEEYIKAREARQSE